MHLGARCTCPDLSLRYFPNQVQRPAQEPLPRHRVTLRVRNFRLDNWCFARRLPWIPTPFSSSSSSWSFLVAAIMAEDATTKFPAAERTSSEEHMYRRRGRTVGTIIIGAIIIAAMICVAFGGSGLTAVQTPFVIAAAEPMSG
jgi:hypothetical protein